MLCTMLRQIANKAFTCKSYVLNTQQRQALNRLHFRPQSSTAATFAKVASPALTPTIADVLVEITLVDPKGARRKVKGMVGKFF